MRIQQQARQQSTASVSILKFPLPQFPGKRTYPFAVLPSDLATASQISFVDGHYQSQRLTRIERM
jgi:hypothetical protein